MVTGCFSKTLCWGCCTFANIFQVFLHWPILLQTLQFHEGVTTRIVAFDTAEEKQKFKIMGVNLTKADEGPAKATCVIINALAKIIDAPLEPSHDDFHARCYLFLCLHDDAKKELIACLTESLKSYFGKSFFTYVKLKNKYRGHEIERLLIREVKERTHAVFM